MITYVQVMIYSQCKIINHKPYWAPANYNLSHLTTATSDHGPILLQLKGESN